MEGFTIACIIAGVFFMFLLGVAADGFIRQWIDEQRERSAVVRVVYDSNNDKCGN